MTWRTSSLRDLLVYVYPFLLLPTFLVPLGQWNWVGFGREELTFEMLTLEPRASDDETLESEASIGTADSSENLNFDSEGAISDRSGKSRCSWFYCRMVWGRRDLETSFGPTPCNEHDHLQLDEVDQVFL